MFAGSLNGFIRVIPKLPDVISEPNQNFPRDYQYTLHNENLLLRLPDDILQNYRTEPHEYEIRQNREAVIQCIQQALESPDGILNLNGCDREAIEAIPSEVIEALAGKIDSLRLPSALSQLPPWLENLASTSNLNIHKLELPSYEGMEINLRQLKLDRLEANNSLFLKKVHVPKGTIVCCPRNAINKKVQTIFYDENNSKVGKGTAINRIYYTVDDLNKIRDDNFNAKTLFKNSEQKILCKHLVLQEIIDQQNLDKDKAKGSSSKRRTLIRIKNMGDEEHITEYIKPEIQEIYSKLRRYAPENYVVGHTQWGEFFTQQFSRMRPSDRKYFMLSTTKHSMAFKLALKENTENESKRYAVSLYDPNRTLTHERFVSDDLWKSERYDSLDDGGLNSVASLNSVARLNATAFLKEQAMELYYGKESNSSPAQVSHFFVVPKDLDEQLDIEQGSSAQRHRTVKMFLSEQEKSDPTVSYHLIHAGLPLNPILNNQLDACNNSAERVAVLTAKHSTGEHSGIFNAVLGGNDIAVKEWCNVVQKTYADEKLTGNELANVLTLGDNKMLGFPIAIGECKPSTIKALGELILKARESKALTNEELAARLATRDKDQKFFEWNRSSVGSDLAGKIAVFGELVLTAHKHKWLNNQQVEDLLTSLSKGVSLFHEVLKSGDPGAIEAFTDILKKADEANALKANQVKNLLTASNAQNEPGFSKVLQNNNPKAVQVFGNALIELYAAGALTTDDVENFLTARNVDGEPILFNALQGKNPEIISAFGSLFMASYKAGALMINQVENLLAAKNHDGKSGFFEALQGTELDVIEAFGTAVRNAQRNLRDEDASRSLEFSINLYKAVDSGTRFDEKANLGLHAVMLDHENLHLPVIQIFWEIVQDAKKAGRGMTNQGIAELLDVRNILGEPMMHLHAIHPESYPKKEAVITMWGNMVEKAQSQKWLDEEKTLMIINPNFDGKSYIQHFAVRGNLEEIQAYVHLLKQLKPSKIMQQSLHDSLQSALYRRDNFFSLPIQNQRFNMIKESNPEAWKALKEFLRNLKSKSFCYILKKK